MRFLVVLFLFVAVPLHAEPGIKRKCAKLAKEEARLTGRAEQFRIKVERLATRASEVASTAFDVAASIALHNADADVPVRTQVEIDAFNGESVRLNAQKAALIREAAELDELGRVLNVEREQLGKEMEALTKLAKGTGCAFSHN